MGYFPTLIIALNFKPKKKNDYEKDESIFNAATLCFKHQ